MKKSFLLIFLSIFSFATIHAEITWTLSDDGTLTISGTGDMPGYGYQGTPWYYQRDKIKKVVIENGVTSIGQEAFFKCSSLTSVTIPNSVTSIEREAFCDCLGLTSVNIPNSVTSIGGNAFWGTKWYNNQPDGLVYAGKVLYCYKGTMSSNTKIKINEGTTGIAGNAFWTCYGLTSIIIPNSVMSIGDHAFHYCKGLTSITIPNSVTSIGGYAFEGCSGLTSVTIPNSVTSIGAYAFYGCSSLTSVIIPNSVTKIYSETFYGCSSLTSIIVENKNKIYDSRNNCNAIIEKESNNLIAGCKNTFIPNSVTSIGAYAFEGCSGLTSVSIPNSVTSIGAYAFFGCSGLTSIIIPNSVTSIGRAAFSSCSSLTSITCEATTPPSAIYIYEYIDIPVYVPANSITKYKVTDGWKDFTNIQAIPSTSLTDGTPYTSNLQLNGRDISYTRTFNNTSWQSLYIPFSLNYDDWKDDFEVAYINGVRQLDKDDNGTIDETIMDVIKIKSGSTSPNMPYLIKAKTTGKKTFSVNDATLYPAEENSIDCSTTIAKYTFTGTYNTISSATMIANNYYGMGGGELVQSDGSNDLMPYRWYMNVESRNPSYNASNAAKTITINVIDDEEEMTTGIRQLQITNDELSVYDLNGRKVNENNLKPGIYVKNGKKFVVK